MRPLSVMAHFVFVTAGISSYVHRLSALTRGLLARGHRVSVLSLRESGLRGWPADVCVARLELPAHFVRRPGGLTGRRSLIAKERARANRIIAGEEFVNALAALSPDLVVVDYELHAQIIQAVSRGYPVMLIEYECSPLQTGRVPMPSSPHVPGPGGCTAWRSRASWLGGLLLRRARITASRLYYGGADWWSTIRAVAAREGFDLSGRASRRHWQYLAYPEIPTLYLGPAALDFPNTDPNPGFRVGPVAGMDRAENLDDPAYQQVLGMLERRNSAAVVYCAMGSILSNPGYFRRVIAAVAARPEWSLILAAGRRMDPAALGSIPDNVHVLGHAPQLDVLRRADAMLTHAGPASIYEAVLSGVPLICYSGGAKEEHGNAARVAYHGLGLQGDLRKSSASRIEADIAEVLGHPRYRSSVLRMRERFLRQQESARGLELLEQAAEESPASLPWRRF